MKNKILIAVLIAISAGAYMFIKKPTTYSGQCGPIRFDYSKLNFSITGSVSSIEKFGIKVNLSNVPCMYQEDK